MKRTNSPFWKSLHSSVYLTKDVKTKKDTLICLLLRLAQVLLQLHQLSVRLVSLSGEPHVSEKLLVNLIKKVEEFVS